MYKEDFNEKILQTEPSINQTYTFHMWVNITLYQSTCMQQFCTSFSLWALNAGLISWRDFFHFSPRWENNASYLIPFWKLQNTPLHAWWEVCTNGACTMLSLWKPRRYVSRMWVVSKFYCINILALTYPNTGKGTRNAYAATYVGRLDIVNA